MLDSRPKGRGFEPHRHPCVVSLSKNINPSLVLVQPRKTRPFITERWLMGRKESNQTNKSNMFFCLTGTIFQQVSVERGMSFTGAYDIWKKYTGVEDGFYMSLMVSELLLDRKLMSQQK